MRAVGPMKRRAGGFTLVEAIITMAIAVIVLTAATPSFSALVEKQRLDGAASRLVVDIQFARAESMRRGENVLFSLHGTSGGCYLLHTGAVSACTCTDDGASSCTGSAEALKAVGLGTGASIRIEGDVKSLKFNPLHGTSTPAGKLTLTGASGRSIRTTITQRGMVHTCSPSTSAPAVPGYAVC